MEVRRAPGQPIEVVSLHECIRRATGASVREIVGMGMSAAFAFGRDCARELGVVLHADATQSQIQADRDFRGRITSEHT